MPVGLRVVHPGPHASVQDLGRPDAARWGVPRAGALDVDALRLGNGLVGNPAVAGGTAGARATGAHGPVRAAGAAAVEVLFGGFGVAVEAPHARLLLACFAGGRLEATGRRRRSVPPWQALDATDGEVVRAVPSGVADPAAGPAYLVVAGGIDVPVVLGSRSTDLRTGFGGVEGRRLVADDALPLVRAATGPPSTPPLALVPAPSAGAGPLRVVLGPQSGRLAPDAPASLNSSVYRVGGEADRMGVRLAGPPLAWAEGATEMLSAGVVPGSIQVPRGGQPILLRADCQTTGGYPLVAAVCTADLSRVGRLRPGHEVRFAAVTVAEAHALRRRREAALARWLGRGRPARPPPDVSALHAVNLVSGVADARKR